MPHRPRRHTGPLRELTDRRAGDATAVFDALLRFGLAQDRRYDPGAVALFESASTEDAVLDFRPAAATCGIDVPLMRGRDMITSIIMDPATRLDTTHAFGNPRIHVDGDTAHLTALVEAQHLPTGDHTRHALLKNHYAATLRHVDDLWRIHEVRIECAWFTGDPLVILGR
ncbi:nuclear transport factor 2 family protein [Umezawaea tangerina]|uniref:SnoaL-like protein n=1 Tax=Umezawaea tangerina TaxID=84725 RepID=A0A2T0T2D3_9PSEU|nr:nuclear transport factor 2 family protein [Umezawaea tangerina]PRY39793.1 SnoaL-like protein [Umezawaea tangerina]